MPVSPTLGMQHGVRIPDLMVVFDCDMEDAYRIDGYAIDRQGKPPDFVLEGGIQNDRRSGLHRQSAEITSASE